MSLTALLPSFLFRVSFECTVAYCWHVSRFSPKQLFIALYVLCSVLAESTIFEFSRLDCI